MIAKNEASLNAFGSSLSRARRHVHVESLCSSRVCFRYPSMYSTRATLILSLAQWWRSASVYASNVAGGEASRRIGFAASARKNPSPDVVSSAKYSIRMTATIVHAMTKVMLTRKKMD